MLQDLEPCKLLELDCMTGAVIEFADRLGVSVPHLALVDACALLLDRIRLQCGQKLVAID
jgi:ketopantoate reductase